MTFATLLLVSVAATAPQPPAEIRSLEKAFAGRWTIEETFAPGANGADGTASGRAGHGEEVWRSGPGGFTFMEEAHDFTPNGEVFIVGYIWWDGRQRKLAGIECNSQWSQGCDAESSLSRVSLSWDGKEFVIDFRSKEDPRRIVWHEVFSQITPTSFVQTGDVGQPDGTFKRLVTIRARRADDTEAH
jgi:hypothetical protein